MEGKDGAVLPDVDPMKRNRFERTEQNTEAVDFLLLERVACLSPQPTINQGLKPFFWTMISHPQTIYEAWSDMNRTGAGKCWFIDHFRIYW